MIVITPALASILVDQAPAAFATTLATTAFDRAKRVDHALVDCLREGWTSRDMSDDATLRLAFPYDEEFTGQGQTILLHTSPDHGFCILTARLSGETEIECVVVGDGFALVTRDLFAAGWSDWRESNCSDLPLQGLLIATGR